MKVHIYKYQIIMLIIFLIGCKQESKQIHKELTNETRIDLKKLHEERDEAAKEYLNENFFYVDRRHTIHFWKDCDSYIFNAEELIFGKDLILVPKTKDNIKLYFMGSYYICNHCIDNWALMKIIEEFNILSNQKILHENSEHNINKYDFDIDGTLNIWKDYDEDIYNEEIYNKYNFNK
jgi:hypothetical protein